MSDAHFSYWRESLQSSLDEHGVTITDAQLDSVSRDMELSHENYGMAFYTPEPPSVRESDLLRAELKAEREKVHCRHCDGRGSITTQGPYHSSTSRCWKCNGEGKHKP